MDLDRRRTLSPDLTHPEYPVTPGEALRGVKSEGRQHSGSGQHPGSAVLMLTPGSDYNFWGATLEKCTSNITTSCQFWPVAGLSVICPFFCMVFRYKHVSSPGSDSVVHKLSYGELDLATNRLARALLARLAPLDGDVVVAVSLPPSEALLLTLLAVWKAGAAYLPLDQQAPQRVHHILEEAKPALIITEEAEDQLDEVLQCHNVVSFSTLDTIATKMAATILSDSEVLPATAQPLAVVLYTSGSTGVPKGVRLPHAVVLNRLRWQWREFPFSPTEQVCVFKTTLTFVDAIGEIWGPLLHSSPIGLLVVPREITKDPQRLIPLLEEYKVERLLVVPTLLRAILLFLGLDSSQQLASLKTWVCSGEPLVVSLAEQFLSQFRHRDVALCNFYGSTEVMGDVTYHVIRSREDLAAFDKVPIVSNSNSQCPTEKMTITLMIHRTLFSILDELTSFTYPDEY
ncbi:hypothetical protein J6590_055646 [Homalodisca vitripennis]|nr:hypothetical protein J6590_055646 [Homalodisca vitripennis]